MDFAGLTRQSLTDYPGEVAAVLFTRGCNFRCPYCHNPQLVFNDGKKVPSITLEEVLEFLEQRKNFIDAVVISGGEPTLHRELPGWIRRIKETNCLVKLDTNGTNTAMIKELLEEKLLDYIALDIKAPMDYKKYQKSCIKITAAEFFNIRNTIHLLQNSPVYAEFRTTIVPVIHKAEDIVAIARYLEGSARYTLQQFNPRITLDHKFQSVRPYSQKTMEQIAEQCRPYISEVTLLYS